MTDHQVYAAIAVVVVLALALWLSLRALRRAENLATRQLELETELAAARAALAQAEVAAGEAAEQLQQRLAETEARIAAVEERQEQLRLMEEGDGDYGRAIRMARQGASAEELAQDFGLNRGEAELLVSLHGKPGDS